MKIRPYLEKDYEHLIRLLALNTPAYFSPSEQPSFEHYLRHEIEYYYLVEIDESVYACGGLNRSKDGETMMISWDIVHPDWHGKGLGTSLMNHRISLAQSVPEVTTLSVRTSQLTYPFYEKFGLQLKEIVNDYWDKGFDMYRLECPIKSAIAL